MTSHRGFEEAMEEQEHFRAQLALKLRAANKRITELELNATRYDEDTLYKAMASLIRCGLSSAMALNAINEMLNDGILLRERVQ